MSLYKLSLVSEIFILVLFLPDEVNQSIIIRSVDFDYTYAIPVSHYYCMDGCIFCLQLLTVELSRWLYFCMSAQSCFLIDIGFYIIIYFYYNCCVCVLSFCFMQSPTPVYLPFSCWQCIFVEFEENCMGKRFHGSALGTNQRLLQFWTSAPFSFTFGWICFPWFGVGVGGMITVAP